MFFYRRFIPGLAIQSYVIGDEKSKKCAVIDPVRDVGEYVQLAEHEGFHITDIIETHVHADFVSGSLELKKRLDGKPTIHCSGMGGEEWIPSYADHIVQEGDTISLGDLELKAVHTPGHTPEHVIWVLSEKGKDIWLFTGDLLFVGDVGRPDLLGEEANRKLSKQLYHSIFDTLSHFPDSIEIYPAHGAGSLCGKAIGSTPHSTLGREREENPALKKKEEQVWIEDLMRGMPKSPPYFPRMKKINVKGPKVTGKSLPGKIGLSPSEVEEKIAKGSIVLDTRSKEAFSAAHIPGSINIALSPQLSFWSGWILPSDSKLVVILEDQEDFESVATELLRVGFDEIEGFLEGGIKSWEEQGNALSHIETQSVDELYEKMQKSPPFILDVRTNSEWEKGHIKGAHHIHAGLVEDCLEMIPKDQPVAVVCGSGFRASIAASVLKRAGYQDVSNVFGGMSAWKERGREIVKP